MKNLLLFVFISSLIISCNKEPGEGGLATITGKVNVEDYNQNFTTLWGEYPGADLDVYIIYGNNVTFNDRVKTGPDGTYQFIALTKGDYKIYTYSKDSSLQSPSGQLTIMENVTIADKRQEVTVPTMTIFE